MSTSHVQYLYLLFDEDNQLHGDDLHYVLTTEGHILTLPRDLLKPMSPSRRRMRGEENHQCPVYQPSLGSRTPGRGDVLVRGVGWRSDIEYVRYLIGVKSQPSDERYWSLDGWCEIPHTELFVSRISMFATWYLTWFAVIRFCHVLRGPCSAGRSESRYPQTTPCCRRVRSAKCYRYPGPHCQSLGWQGLRYHTT